MKHMPFELSTNCPYFQYKKKKTQQSDIKNPVFQNYIAASRLFPAIGIGKCTPRSLLWLKDDTKNPRCSEASN